MGRPRLQRIADVPRWLKRLVIVLAVIAGASLPIMLRGEGPLLASEPVMLPQPAMRRGGGRLTFAPAARPRALFPDGALHPVASLLDVPQRLAYGDFAWNEAGVPAGRVWVRVDLDRQILSVFRGAHEIGTAVILYGADSKPTPLGVFPIMARLRDHRSSLYEAPMPYTLRLTGDGVAIHGSNVRAGAATHGCVGVPEAFAAKLFDAIRVGDPVMIVARDKSKTDRLQA